MKKLYEDIIDITGHPEHLIQAGKSYVQPGRVDPIVTIEEYIPGFKFSIIVTENDLTITPDTEHNTAFNASIKFETSDILKILSRWPSVSMELFNKSPIPAYTMILVYFNQDILGNMASDFPREGLFVIDVIPTNSDDIGRPLNQSHKSNLAKSMGLVVAPLSYNGIITDAFQILQHYANTSKITTSGFGHGIRITFEPRINMTSYFINSSIKEDITKIKDTAESLANELANFIVMPERLVKVFQISGINPNTSPEDFAKTLLDYVKNETGYFSDYHSRAILLDELCSAEEFTSMVLETVVKLVNKIAPQMTNYFTYRK